MTTEMTATTAELREAVDALTEAINTACGLSRHHPRRVGMDSSGTLSYVTFRAVWKNLHLAHSLIHEANMSLYDLQEQEREAGRMAEDLANERDDYGNDVGKFSFLVDRMEALRLSAELADSNPGEVFRTIPGKLGETTGYWVTRLLKYDEASHGI